MAISANILPMPFRDTLLPLTSSKTLWQVTLLAIGMGAYSVLPLIKEMSPFRDTGDIPSDMHAALSLTLGCLLVFRTNTAYSRWWEARTQWGALVNATRNLSLKLTTLARPSADDGACLQSNLIAFAKQLMTHLRDVPKNGAQAERPAKHLPLETVQFLYAWIGKQRNAGKLDGDELRVIDAEMSKLLEICGACERIARTPIVRSYRIFARQCVVLFLLTLPWGVAQDFQWWTIPLTVIVSYFMIGMEIVAEHVEEPFGLDEDDLDLDGICETIEQSVHQVFENTPA